MFGVVVLVVVVGDVDALGHPHVLEALDVVQEAGQGGRTTGTAHLQGSTDGGGGRGSEGREKGREEGRKEEEEGVCVSYDPAVESDRHHLGGALQPLTTQLVKRVLHHTTRHSRPSGPSRHSRPVV